MTFYGLQSGVNCLKTGTYLCHLSKRLWHTTIPYYQLYNNIHEGQWGQSCP